MLLPADYKTLVEQSPIIIWRADTSGKCDYFNERWLAFTGRTLEQELGDGWAEGVHPDDLGRCLETYLAAFSARTVFEMEYRLRRHDGAWRWIFDRGAPSYDAAGNFAGFIGSCYDVTDRVDALAALERLHAAEIAEMSRLVPVCAGCKRVRDDEGFWNGVDTYLRRHEGLRVTHGLCEACESTLDPPEPTSAAC